MAFLNKDEIQSSVTENGVITDMINQVRYEQQDGQWYRVSRLVERRTRKVKRDDIPLKATSRPRRQAGHSKWFDRAKHQNARAPIGGGSKSGTFMDRLHGIKRQVRQDSEQDKTVMLRNIPLDRDEVRDWVCDELGCDRRALTRVNVVMDRETGALRNMAFVVFRSCQEADQAIERLHRAVVGHMIVHAERPKAKPQ